MPSGPDRRTADPAQLLSVTALPVVQPGHVVLRVAGEVDHYTAPLLRACLHGQAGRGGVRRLTVDMTRVHFLGAAGVSALAEARRNCLTRRVRLVVRCGGRPEVARPLELTGLADLLADDAARRVIRERKGSHASVRSRSRRSGRTGRPPAYSDGQEVAR